MATVTRLPSLLPWLLLLLPLPASLTLLRSVHAEAADDTATVSVDESGGLVFDDQHGRVALRELVNENRQLRQDLAAALNKLARVEKQQLEGNSQLLWEKNTVARLGAARMPRAGDIDGDGDLDLVVVQGENITMFRNNGHGNFSSTAETLYVAPVGFVLSDNLLLEDLNNDGKAELAVELCSSLTPASCYQAVVSHSASNLTMQVENTIMSFKAILLADLNNDSLVDLVGRNPQGNMQIVLHTGSFNFLLVHTSSQTFTAPTHISTFDVNRDGRLDILFGDPRANNWTWVANGVSSVFSQPVTFDTIPSAGRTWMIDVDGDGWLDQVYCSSGGSNPCFARRKVSSSTLPDMLICDESSTDFQFADINGDGVLDMLGSCMRYEAFPHPQWLSVTVEFAFQRRYISRETFFAKDLNGDGGADFVALARGPGDGYSLLQWCRYVEFYE